MQRGIPGWGFGLEETAGRPTARLASGVTITHKRPLAEPHPHERIAARHQPEPLSSGAMIVNAHGVPGTLGCVAWTRDGQEVLVSSWHVMFGAGAGIGDIVSAMTPDSDGRVPAGHALRGTIGATRHAGEPFHVDAAIAVRSPARPRRGGPASTAPRAAAWAVPGAIVRKMGAASNATRGIVVDVAYRDIAMVVRVSLHFVVHSDGDTGDAPGA